MFEQAAIFRRTKLSFDKELSCFCHTSCQNLARFCGYKMCDIWFVLVSHILTTKLIDLCFLQQISDCFPCTGNFNPSIPVFEGFGRFFWGTRSFIPVVLHISALLSQVTHGRWFWFVITVESGMLCTVVRCSLQSPRR